MSSYGLPDTITVGGASGPTDTNASSTPGGADAEALGGPTEAVGLVRRAKALLSRALLIENDHEDALILERCTTELTKYLATHQKLVDAPNANPQKTLRSSHDAKQGREAIRTPRRCNA